MKKAPSVLALLALALPAAARGDWSDDFESYALGDICGQGGWEAFGGGRDICGQVSDEQALSGRQSLKIIGATGPAGDDTVHRFNEYGGRWTFRTQTFTPGSARGQMLISLLNTYPTTGNFNNWSMVVTLDADYGEVVRYPDEVIGDLITDRWVEFRVEIDIDEDSYDIYYDGQLLEGGLSWRDAVEPGGQPRIQALDLYGGEPDGRGTTGTYFDDAALISEGGGSLCRYKLKKNSKSLRCSVCPRKNDIYVSQARCDGIEDCDKKLKIRRIPCPDGFGKACKGIKGKRDSCR